MKRSDFRIKEYRGKFYIERKLETPTLQVDGNLKVLGIKTPYPLYRAVTVISWARVDDYGNYLEVPNIDDPRYVNKLTRYLERKLDYFKSLKAAKNKVDQFFQEPKYYYL